MSKVGITGQKITCETNYFRLTKQFDWNIYHYRVDFMPEVLDARTRRRLIATQRAMLGGYLFDGTQLFITRTLESETVTRVIPIEENNGQENYTITFRLTRMVAMSESQSLQILNLILRRAMDGLHLETVGRNKFDPDAAVSAILFWSIFHLINKSHIFVCFILSDFSTEFALANLARLYHIDSSTRNRYFGVCRNHAQNHAIGYSL